MDYKKILEGVVDIINTTEKSDIGFVNICSYIGENCPELKESEDERIRKEMIFYFTKEIPQCSIQEHADKMKEFIAWLEKQGEHADFRNKIQIGDKVTRNEDGVLVNLSQLNRVAKKDEKQCEQNPADINPLLSWSSEEEKMLQCLEGIVKDYWAKSEQEKNELKIREASNVSFFLKTIHKSPLCWIKCSDRLPNRDGIYLVVTDGIHNDVYDMARYDSIEGWHKASEIIYWMPIPQLNDKSIIEQKPAEWSEEDEIKINRIVSCLENLNVADNDILLKDINWLKDLKDRVQQQPKQEWRQENIGDLTDFESAMMHIGGSFFGEHQGLDPNDTFVVKEQAKILLEMAPKQEWSEEDERIVTELIGIFESAVDGGHVTFPYRLVKDYIRVLKSCLSQNTWKPSDEQIEILDMVLTNESMDDNIARILRELREQLKKLKDE